MQLFENWCVGFADALFSFYDAKKKGGDKCVSVLDVLLKKAQALPEQPGVYLMKNSSGEIIYIGKAKNLKNRVSQYFGSQNRHTLKVLRMVENVRDFDYIIVSTEFEALVLECNLIKQHTPKYNILLKDDKGYHYIKVKKGEWKMLYSVKQKTDEPDVEFLGPYTASEYVSSAVKQALDVFRLPHCKKVFPQDISKNSRPCLNYYIKLCSGACCGKVTQKEHNEAVDAALDFVLGGKSATVSQWKKEMLEASENLEFEKAAKLRDRIQAVEKTSQKQHVVSLKYKNQDIFGIASLNAKSCLSVLRFRNGDLVDTDTFVFDRIENIEDEYTEIIANFYAEHPDFPDRVCVDVQLENFSFLEEYLSFVAKKKVTLYYPKAGEGVTLVEMAKKNASEKLARKMAYDDKKRAALIELQEILQLKDFPGYIEAYDISNTNGSENVAGMVVFRNGRPSKKNYRRFMIKSFEGQDDYRSLAEVINRRINEYHLNEGAQEGFGVKPDLILLDGGAGQVNTVKEVLERRGFDVPLFGMVKDSKHRTRAISSGGAEIAINDNRSVFNLVADIQEEVHRYAITYHRQLKKKRTLGSILTQIDGVGEKRAKILLKNFKSIDALSKAEVEDLLALDGINETVANNIYLFFRGENDD